MIRQRTEEIKGMNTFALRERDFFLSKVYRAIIIMLFKRREKSMSAKKYLAFLLPVIAAACVLLLLIKTDNVYAGVVHSAEYYESNPDEASSMSSSDTGNIMEELESTGSVTLVSGEDYYLGKITLEKGWKINAQKANIYASGRLFECNNSVSGYKKLDAKVSGGIWRYSGSGGHSLTAIQLSHVDGITFEDMDIKYCNYEGHTFEFIACRNVTVKNCKIRCYGKPSSTSVEEQIQLDIDAPATAPTTGVHNGKCCENVTITGCDIVGARAVCANYAASDRGKYLKKFHKNITVKNCKLTSKTAEALALFNVKGITVKGNTIINNAPVKRNSYSDGMAVTYFGSGASGGEFIIKKNTIKGGRYALLVYSHSSSKFGNVTIASNNLYCKNGASNALKTASVSKLKTSGNKTYSW